ncbi:MAG TPA: NADH-quinone oxidoreductase subunit L [Candidatus Acidoferrales bacterium]|nr:NADH-quinone oxidoreductase subunit L [Candidatus Acidoferrales bacterium]
MLYLLWLIPALPLAGFVALALFGPYMKRVAISAVGVGSVGISALISILITASFLGSTPANGFYDERLWSWISIGDFHPQIGLYLDSLSLIMMLVVTFVSFLIHLYSAEFMEGDEGYSRFFAYMNLFVASMVILLLGDNLLLLFVGWEGVGLCSYLLIGFWYTDPVNGLAARKAFIVTRVGDTAFIIGLFLLFEHLGTFHIQELMHQATLQWHSGSPYAIAAAALLLGGAIGKSAQLPLQTWLPDAMAGPTPTSALIHAATMVTAGVYLIARTHVLYELAPPVQLAVAVIGAITLLVAGCSALAQTDIKRILAYSTVSQIGYMFLGLGVGAWSAAIFHFMTHAFFKALLFLVAGVVIEGLHHEHNIFKMGGLREKMPVAFWGFVIGGASLAGAPIVTAGFYSKGMIVWAAWSARLGSGWLWIAALVGVFLTSTYISRLIFIVFFGDRKTEAAKHPGLREIFPIVALSLLSIVGGFVELPAWMGNYSGFTNFLARVLPGVNQARSGGMSELGSEGLLFIAFLAGIALAYVLFYRKRELAESLTSNTIGRAIRELWYSDWAMDWLYDHAFVQPVKWFARVDKNDPVDSFYDGVAATSRACWRGLRVTESGRVRWYAASIAIGTVLVIILVIFL